MGLYIWRPYKLTLVGNHYQTCDSIIFEAPYLRNCARWTHGHYGPPIGTRLPGVEWSRNR